MINGLSENHRQIKQELSEITKVLSGLIDDVEKLTLIVKELKKPEIDTILIKGRTYIKYVDNVISRTTVNWHNNDYSSYLIKLNDLKESYSIFIPLSNKIIKGSKIVFTYDGTINLKKVKILE